MYKLSAAAATALIVSANSVFASDCILPPLEKGEHDIHPQTVIDSIDEQMDQIRGAVAEPELVEAFQRKAIDEIRKYYFECQNLQYQGQSEDGFDVPTSHLLINNGGANYIVFLNNEDKSFDVFAIKRHEKREVLYNQLHSRKGVVITSTVDHYTMRGVDFLVLEERTGQEKVRALENIVKLYQTLNEAPQHVVTSADGDFIGVKALSFGIASGNFVLRQSLLEDGSVQSVKIDPTTLAEDEDGNYSIRYWKQENTPLSISSIVLGWAPIIQRELQHLSNKGQMAEPNPG